MVRVCLVAAADWEMLSGFGFLCLALDETPHPLLLRRTDGPEETGCATLLVLLVLLLVLLLLVLVSCCCCCCCCTVVVVVDDVVDVVVVASAFWLLVFRALVSCGVAWLASRAGCPTSPACRDASRSPSLVVFVLRGVGLLAARAGWPTPPQVVTGAAAWDTAAASLPAGRGADVPTCRLVLCRTIVRTSEMAFLDVIVPPQVDKIMALGV